jgi:catechol 2,3-dioxygenase-like lactoylglutathione lyase family enzyme
MLKNSPFFAGYGVDDTEAARAFYADLLGVQVDEIGPGLLGLRAGNGYAVFVYERPGHRPADHTVLNFPVDDIDVAVDELTAAGVEFEQYDEDPIKTNEKGIAEPGPRQAWFKDPAGNILSVIQ